MFEHVAVIRGPGIVSGRNGNSVVVASQSPLNVESLAERLAADREPGDDPDPDPDRVLGELLTGDDLAAYLDGATILTDDFAPVDQLIGG